MKVITEYKTKTTKPRITAFRKTFFAAFFIFEKYSTMEVIAKTIAAKDERRTYHCKIVRKTENKEGEDKEVGEDDEDGNTDSESNKNIRNKIRKVTPIIPSWIFNQENLLMIFSSFDCLFEFSSMFLINCL